MDLLILRFCSYKSGSQHELEILHITTAEEEFFFKTLEIGLSFNLSHLDGLRKGEIFVFKCNIYFVS